LGNVETTEDSNDAGITLFISMQPFIELPSLKVKKRKLVE